MSRIGPVLVLDDDADVLRAVAMALSRHADTIEGLSDPDAVETALARSEYAVLLLDMNFVPGEHSGRAGLDVLDRVRASDPTLSVVLMTVYGRVALAVDALKRGAVDFVIKPWRNARLVEALGGAADLTRARRVERDSLNLNVVEKRAIERALARYDGNVSQAAAALGLKRPTLYRRMSKYGL